VKLPRTEADAFRALIYVVIAAIVVIAIVVVVRALS
jgi:CHASE3 domain sensor protein